MLKITVRFLLSLLLFFPYNSYAEISQVLQTFQKKCFNENRSNYNNPWLKKTADHYNIVCENKKEYGSTRIYLPDPKNCEKNVVKEIDCKLGVFYYTSCGNHEEVIGHIDLLNCEEFPHHKNYQSDKIEFTNDWNRDLTYFLRFQSRVEIKPSAYEDDDVEFYSFPSGPAFVEWTLYDCSKRKEKTCQPVKTMKREKRTKISHQWLTSSKFQINTEAESWNCEIKVGGLISCKEMPLPNTK